MGLFLLKEQQAQWHEGLRAGVQGAMRGWGSGRRVKKARTGV